MTTAFLARIASRVALATLLAIPALPASADDTNWYVRKQHQEQCERDGGRYEYPVCHLPDRNNDHAPARKPDCDLQCAAVISGLGLLIGAWCAANPGKC